MHVKEGTYSSQERHQGCGRRIWVQKHRTLEYHGYSKILFQRYLLMPRWCISGVSSAAHAELFLGHFKVAELGFMGVRTINGLGKFVNAPQNRCVQ